MTLSKQCCYLCGRKKFKKRPGRVRDNPKLKVLECLSCGLVFLSSLSHIDNNFYELSKMHGTGALDENVWLRETAWDDERRFACFRRLTENKAVLDFGCGNGGFLLRARETASRAAGIELEARLKPYYKKNKLNVFPKIEHVTGSFDVITLFHVLEHIADPIALLKQCAKKLNKDGQIIVEVPNANDALLTLYQSKSFSCFTYWSCHLFLFNNETLAFLAKQSELKVNYIKQIQRYPLSNHLYWLSKNKPGGHREWSFLDSPELCNAYEKQLASMGCCDTVIASFS